MEINPYKKNLFLKNFKAEIYLITNFEFVVFPL